MGAVASRGSPDAALELPGGDGRTDAGAAPVLSLRGLRKAFDQNAAPVLSSVDLELEPGVAVAVHGANGAGKTTLLRIVAGLLVADAGTIRVCGLDPVVARERCQRELGFLSAGNTGLYARLKAEHHLELWMRLALMPRSERRAAQAAALDAFGLAPLCGRRVDRLSMGQRQRLRLALAFVHRPRMVLLDEPATSLDEEGMAALDAALAELKARGGAAVVCLPSGWETPAAVDRGYLLADGTLEAA